MQEPTKPDPTATGPVDHLPRLLPAPASTPGDVVSSTRSAVESLQRLDPAVSWPSLADAQDLPPVVQALADDVRAVQAVCGRLSLHLADVEDRREGDPALLAALAELADAERQARDLVTALAEARAALAVVLRPAD